MAYPNPYHHHQHAYYPQQQQQQFGSPVRGSGDGSGDQLGNIFSSPPSGRRRHVRSQSMVVGMVSSPPPSLPPPSHATPRRSPMISPPHHAYHLQRRASSGSDDVAATVPSPPAGGMQTARMMRRGSAPDISRMSPPIAGKETDEHRVRILETEVAELRQKLHAKSLDLQQWQSLIRGDGSLMSLFQACRVGEVEVVRFLLQQGVNINSADASGMTALMVAASEGQEEVFEFLLSHRRIKGPDDVGAESYIAADLLALNANTTALIHASRAGQVRMVEKLLDAEAEIDHMSNNGVTPLIAAAREGRTDVMEVLVRSRCDINLCSGKHPQVGTALMAAIHTRHLPVIDFLLRSGAQLVSTVHPLYPRTEVAVLCERMDADAVNIFKMILQVKQGRKLPLLKSSKRKLRPLMVAAKMGSVQMIELLLEHSAQPTMDSRDAYGWTAVMHACRNDRRDAVQFLLEHGARADDGANGYTVFNIAVAGNAVDTLQVVVAQGADVRSECVPEMEDKCAALLLATESQMTAVQRGLEYRHSFIDAVMCSVHGGLSQNSFIRNAVFMYLGLITGGDDDDDDDANARDRSHSL